MTPTPTPAPALTDEQFDTASAAIRECFDDAGMHEVHDAWFAAVIDRAKREAAEEIAQSIETMPIAGFNGETLAWLKVAREMCAACARQIGADHA